MKHKNKELCEEEIESPPTRGRELKRAGERVDVERAVSPPTRGRELKHSSQRIRNS